MVHALYSRVSSGVGLVYWRWKEGVGVLLIEGRYTENWTGKKERGRGAGVHKHEPTQNIDLEND